MATVFDDQGVAYDSVQVTVPTPIGNFTVPVGWWIVTDPFGRRSPVSPQSYLTMFSPAQGVLNLGTPGGAASLDKNSLVIQHSNFEGQPNGTATLDGAGQLVQRGGLATINGAGQVQQAPASYGQPNGAATLDGSSHLVQTGGLVLASELAAPGGVATLDANGHVQQEGSLGVYRKWAYQNTSAGNLNGTAWGNYPYGLSAALQIVSDGTGLFLVRCSLKNLNTGGAPVQINFRLSGNSTTYDFGGVTLTDNSSLYALSFPAYIGALAAGNYPCTLQYKLNAGVNVGHAVGDLAIEIEQFG